MKKNFINPAAIIAVNGMKERAITDTILPSVLVPFLIYLASLHFSLTFIIFVTIPLLISHIYLVFKYSSSNSKFLYVWSAVSLFFIFMCLELLIVPLHIISSIENILFYILFVVILVISYKVKKSSLFYTKNFNRILNISYNDIGFCSTCQSEVPEISVHCTVCRSCVFQRIHHNFWIDCCINSLNYKNYVVLLISIFMWLFYAVYLILTSVCASRLEYNFILVPNNCSNVYSDWRYAVSFMTAIYCLEIIILLLCILLPKCILNTSKIIKEHILVDLL